MLTFQIHQKLHKLSCVFARSVISFDSGHFDVRVWHGQKIKIIDKQPHYFNISIEKKLNIKRINNNCVWSYVKNSWPYNKYTCIDVYNFPWVRLSLGIRRSVSSNCRDTKTWCKLFTFDHFIIRFPFAHGNSFHLEQSCTQLAPHNCFEMIVWITSHTHTCEYKQKGKKNYRFVFVDRASVGMLCYDNFKCVSV